MTEEEAKTKWCPMARALGTLTKPGGSAGTSEVVTAHGPHNRGYALGGGLHNCMCIASACMTWRWDAATTAVNSNARQPRGWCGLAGKP